MQKQFHFPADTTKKIYMLIALFPCQPHKRYQHSWTQKATKQWIICWVLYEIVLHCICPVPAIYEGISSPYCINVDCVLCLGVRWSYWTRKLQFLFIIHRTSHEYLLWVVQLLLPLHYDCSQSEWCIKLVTEFSVV